MSPAQSTIVSTHDLTDTRPSANVPTRQLKLLKSLDYFLHKVPTLPSRVTLSFSHFDVIGIRNSAEDGRMRRGTNFLSLPLELRIMIYELYFDMRDCIPASGEPLPESAPWRQLEPLPGIHNPNYVRDWRTVPLERIKKSRAVCANDKVPLLRASKAVYADARPFFYLYHTFAFATGNLYFRQQDYIFRPAEYIDMQPLGWLTKVELTNSKKYFPRPAEHDEQNKVEWQLLMLARNCHRLKHLVVELHLQFDYYRRPLRILSKISGRLSYLEIRVQRAYGPFAPRSTCLDTIAPLEYWMDGGIKELEGYTIYGGMARPMDKIEQNTYVLDRSKKSEQGGSQSAFKKKGQHLRLFRPTAIEW